MSSEKRIKEMYNSTFTEVHASDELKGLVENMAENKNRIWKNALKKGAAVAAVVAIAFATGNMATYAATGSSLLSFVSVKINDVKWDDNWEKKTDDKGNDYYEGKIKGKNGEVVEIKYSDKAVEAELEMTIGDTVTPSDTETTYEVEVDPETIINELKQSEESKNVEGSKQSK